MVTEKTGQRLRLTLRQLETFVAIASAGSTRGAAELVARSQSAASTALADLEQALGAQLFDRVGRRLLLNENGRAVLPHAAAALDKAAEVESYFSAAHGASLHLASSFTIGEYLLPGLVSGWKRTHPASQVRLDIANTGAVLDAVARFEADLGFIEGSRTHPDLVVRHWLDDELVVIAAPTHPWAGTHVSPGQLAEATWVVRESGSGTREATDRWLVPALKHVSVELELGSNEAVKRAVASGLGLGCLSRHAVAHAVAEGWLATLATGLPTLRRALAIVRHRHKPLGAAARDFLAHCEAEGRRLPRGRAAPAGRRRDRHA